LLYELYLIFDINILRYISVRAFLSFIFSMGLCMLFIDRFIVYSRKKLYSQPIYGDAPESHKKKKDTPTMGGVFFILASVISALLFADMSNNYVLIGLFVLVLFMFLGLKDDFGKVFYKDNQAGLKPRHKLIFQIVLSLFVAVLLYFVQSSFLYVPFYKYPIIDMGVYSILFWVLVLVSTSNAVNLTDGLDGLAVFPSFLAILTLSVIVYIMGNYDFSMYFLVPFSDESSELIVLSCAFSGALLGFLWFNANPASIFMGDSGSLPMGAFIAYMAIVAKSEVLLLIIGFVFIVEVLSVILQVFSYKIRKKRIFLMSPIHHHFELKGISESKIIVRFWIVSLLCNLLALLSLKIR